MSNSIHGSILSRLIEAKTEQREIAATLKDLNAEMKKMPKHERRGIKIAAQRHFETAEQAKERQMSFDFADQLGALRVAA